jgi:hypothetical protein
MDMDKQNEMYPYWCDENDWLCAVEFLPDDDPESRLIAADTIGYLFGYAAITNTRSLALLGDRDANAFQILFSFSSTAGKNQFLDLIRSNEELGNGYVENDLIQPTYDEIERARPLARVLPRDVMAQAALIAATLGTGLSINPTN